MIEKYTILLMTRLALWKWFRYRLRYPPKVSTNHDFGFGPTLFWMSTYLHLRINDFFPEPYSTYISNIKRKKSWNRALNCPIRFHEVFDSIVKGLSTITQISIILHDSTKIELCLSFFIFPLVLYLDL